MKLTNTQIECMIEDLSSEIIRILMEEWQYNMTQAMKSTTIPTPLSV